MRNYKKLKEQANTAIAGAKCEASNLNVIATESHRVSKVARNAHTIIKDIDCQFQQATKLDAIDVMFLFFATALQCVRQYVLSSEKFRFENDQKASKSIKKYLPISLTGPVPYDAFKKYGFDGNTGISGANHRYTTLGHDPLLGWVFGTVNILSETVTKNNIIFESYDTVLVGNEYKISGMTNIVSVFQNSFLRIQDQKTDLPLAVAKHAIHLTSDAFTKTGLPIPIINSISPELSGFLLKNGIDIYGVGRSATMATFINILIGTIHSLFYDKAQHGSYSLYEVKTRKILSYSNIIATSSNIIYVAASKDLKKLDIGGLLVTLYRIINDYRFIKQIKQEFLEKEFYNIVMGDDFNF